jgi:hypothetical protein
LTLPRIALPPRFEDFGNQGPPILLSLLTLPRIALPPRFEDFGNQGPPIPFSPSMPQHTSFVYLLKFQSYQICGIDE